MKRLAKETSFQSLEESGQRLSRSHIGQQVVPSTCSKNQESPVGRSVSK